MNAYFVTATGTDIGKTYVTAGLVRALRRAGRPVFALKPVVSGFSLQSLADSDTGALLRAMDRPLTEDEAALCSPWQFSAPLSPHMAAEREGRTVDPAALVGFCQRAMATSQSNLTLIEGVGGVMVPIQGHWTVLDWMEALALPTILVAGSYLGTISHTLTALEVLRARGLFVSALLVSETPGSTVDLAETAATFRDFNPDVPVVTLERSDTGNEQTFDGIARPL